jgi:hypothetical protein
MPVDQRDTHSRTDEFVDYLNTRHKRNKIIDEVIELIKEKYCPYEHPEIMRSMVSTTSIIEKIETQAMVRLIKELEEMRDG